MFQSNSRLNNDAIAFHDTVACEHASEPGRFILEFSVSYFALRASHRAVMNQRDLLTTPGCNMPVDGIEAGINFAAAKPPV